MIYYKNSDELKHHGIMGMKWGVRRYQNADGTLTEAGKKRYDDVASSNRQSKKDTKAAIKKYTRLSNKANRRANRSIELANEYAELANEYNKYASKGSKEYAQKTQSAKIKSEVQIDKSNEYRKIANEYSKKVSDIETGKIKAGKDFIVQRDFELWVAPLPTKNGVRAVPIAYTKKTVIEK